MTYYLKCKKDTKIFYLRVIKTKNGRTMLLSKCPLCDSKKSRVMKEKETKGLLSSLGIKASLSKIPLLDNILL